MFQQSNCNQYVQIFDVDSGFFCQRDCSIRCDNRTRFLWFSTFLHEKVALAHFMQRCAWVYYKPFLHWPILVQEVPTVTVSHLKSESSFVWYVPRILNTCVQITCYNSWAVFTKLSPRLVHILGSRRVRVAIISGSSQDNSLRWSFFLSLSRVRKCLSALRHYQTLKCFFVSIPMFLSIDRTEKVVVWPPFNTQLNSFVSSEFMDSVPLPLFFTGFACVLEYTRIIFGIASSEETAPRKIETLHGLVSAGHSSERRSGQLIVDWKKWSAVMSSRKWGTLVSIPAKNTGLFKMEQPGKETRTSEKQRKRHKQRQKNKEIVPNGPRKTSVREEMRAASSTMSTKREQGKEEDPVPSPKREDHQKGDGKRDSKGKGPKGRSTSSPLLSKPCTLSLFICSLSRSLKSRRASLVPLTLKLS